VLLRSYSIFLFEFSDKKQKAHRFSLAMGPFPKLYDCVLGYSTVSQRHAGRLTTATHTHRLARSFHNALTLLPLKDFVKLDCWEGGNRKERVSHLLIFSST
jgi:hypothetical protein